MKNLHYKKEMKYLKAVANYFNENGYHAEEPNTKHRDLLDVWGFVNKRRCFEELYVFIYEHRGYLIGCWRGIDEESVELVMDYDGNLIRPWEISNLLGGLKPLRKVKRK
jgi:hypothetical protein